MKFISIIPARGGSKGILRKNLKLLCGKPLIYYTIVEALKSKKLDRVIVSTEDNEIAEISRSYGAEIIERPKELAADDTASTDVVFHVFEELKNQFDVDMIFVLLQPTSPLRTAEDIDKSIDLFINNECDAVISVNVVSHPPYWSLKIENGFLKRLFGIENYLKRRQHFDKVFQPNGAIYISKIELIQKYGDFLGDKTIPYIMPIERSIDIDDEYDLSIAEMMIKKLGYYDS